MIYALIALCLDRVQLKIAAPAYKSSPFRSGYAIIDPVLEGKAMAPMAYRVLMPWLVAVIEFLVPSLKSRRLVWVYEPLKIVMMTFSLWAVSLTLGLTGALIVAVLYCLTFWTDYWDVYIEVGAFALALTGDLNLAILGSFFLALSRETAPLLGLVYGLTTGEWVIAGALSLHSLFWLAAVHLIIGKKKMYCSRWMLRQNIKDLRDILQNKPLYLGEMPLTLLVVGLTIASIVSLPPAWPIPIIVLASGWLMGRAAETRIFATCFIWIAAWMI